MCLSEGSPRLAGNVLRTEVVPPSAYLKIRMSDRIYNTERLGITFVRCYAMPSQVLGWRPDVNPFSEVFFSEVYFVYCPNTQNLKKDFARLLVWSACRSEIEFV
jgi:hypothetical protein